MLVSWRVTVYIQIPQASSKVNISISSPKQNITDFPPGIMPNPSNPLSRRTMVKACSSRKCYNQVPTNEPPDYPLPTVDGRYPASQLRLAVYPMIHSVFYMPGGACRISEPSTVSRELFETISDDSRVARCPESKSCFSSFDMFCWFLFWQRWVCFAAYLQHGGSSTKTHTLTR